MRLAVFTALQLAVSCCLAMPAEKSVASEKIAKISNEPKVTADLEGSESAYAVYPFPYYPAYYAYHHYPYIIYG